MRILLFGAGGLLGRHLSTSLPARGHELVALTKTQADITDATRLDGLFQERWDAVINAAAVCDFDRCEKDPAATGLINYDAPLDLAKLCHARDVKFVQFSSDYIFRGDLARPLTEGDEAVPLSIYGEQKAGIEREIPHLCPHSLILRLSWLYGAGGRTFMSLLPSLLASRPALHVAAGKTGRCLYAPDAAEWTARLLESPLTGTFNLVNDDDTSWELFARACLEEMTALGLRPACREIIDTPYADIGPNWSKRPHQSSLDLSKLRRALPPGPRPWRDALAEYIRREKSFAADPAV